MVSLLTPRNNELTPEYGDCEGWSDREDVSQDHLGHYAVLVEVLCCRDDVVPGRLLSRVHNELKVLRLDVQTGGTVEPLHMENGEVVPLSYLNC